MGVIPEDERFCQVCGKSAIGIEILGCCKVVACEEHASQFLRNLSSGERLEAGTCYYVRY
jgi:hypothetical protein